MHERCSNLLNAIRTAWTVICNAWNIPVFFSQTYAYSSRLTLQNKPRGIVARQVSLLWSLQIFHFHHRNRRKNKPTNFHWKYELWQLRFVGTCKCDILSCLAVCSLIMLINRQMPLCCFTTCMQSHSFVITLPICSHQHDKYFLIH